MEVSKTQKQIIHQLQINGELSAKEIDKVISTLKIKKNPMMNLLDKDMVEYNRHNKKFSLTAKGREIAGVISGW